MTFHCLHQAGSSCVPADRSTTILPQVYFPLLQLLLLLLLHFAVTPAFQAAYVDRSFIPRLFHFLVSYFRLLIRRFVLARRSLGVHQQGTDASHCHGHFGHLI